MEDLGKLEYYRTDTYRSFNRAWKGNFLLFIQPELIRLNRGGGDELPDTIDELRQPALPGDALITLAGVSHARVTEQREGRGR